MENTITRPIISYRGYKITLSFISTGWQYHFEGPPGKFSGSNTGYANKDWAYHWAKKAIDENLVRGV